MIQKYCGVPNPYAFFIFERIVLLCGLKKTKKNIFLDLNRQNYTLTNEPDAGLANTFLKLFVLYVLCNPSKMQKWGLYHHGNFLIRTIFIKKIE